MGTSMTSSEFIREREGSKMISKFKASSYHRKNASSVDAKPQTYFRSPLLALSKRIQTETDQIRKIKQNNYSQNDPEENNQNVTPVFSESIRESYFELQGNKSSPRKIKKISLGEEKHLKTRNSDYFIEKQNKIIKNENNKDVMKESDQQFLTTGQSKLSLNSKIKQMKDEAFVTFSSIRFDPTEKGQNAIQFDDILISCKSSIQEPTKKDHHNQRKETRRVLQKYLPKLKHKENNNVAEPKSPIKSNDNEITFNYKKIQKNKQHGSCIKDSDKLYNKLKERNGKAKKYIENSQKQSNIPSYIKQMMQFQIKEHQKQQTIKSPLKKLISQSAKKDQTYNPPTFKLKNITTMTAQPKCKEKVIQKSWTQVNVIKF